MKILFFVATLMMLTSIALASINLSPTRFKFYELDTQDTIPELSLFETDSYDIIINSNNYPQQFDLLMVIAIFIVYMVLVTCRATGRL